MSEAPTPVASPSPVLIDGADDPVTTAFLTPETVDCQPVCGYESGSPRSSVCLSADEGKVEAAPTSGFEGPEKVLKLEFCGAKGPSNGLRALTREQWDAVLTDAKCSILCGQSNAHFDSYVLSESSLFVYPHVAILKTCGTTTLLMCIQRLLSYTAALGMELEWVGYTRKNFTFPAAQAWPHTSPQHEVAYLRKVVDFNIEAFVLGPITGDHWFVIIADHATGDRAPKAAREVTLNLMMHDLDSSVARTFMDTPEDVNHADVTAKAGFHTILPEAAIQEWAFSPCGYSCNAQLGEAYHTIHITPESHCSYASFETNVKLESYSALVTRVLALFKPKRFTLTVFADKEGVGRVSESPFTASYPCGKWGEFVLTSRSHSEAGDFRSFLGNYRRWEEGDDVIARTTSLRSFFTA